MGSLCLKIEKKPIPGHINKVAARSSQKSDLELKSAAIKNLNQVLSKKQVCLAQKLVTCKLQPHREVRLFVQQFKAPATTQTTNLTDLKEIAVPERISPKSCRSLPSPPSSSASQDSWVEEASPTGIPVSLTGGQRVFRKDREYSIKVQKVHSLPSLSTTYLQSEMHFGKHNRTTTQGDISDNGSLMQVRTQKPPLHLHKVSNVTKIRKDLRKLAVGTSSC